MSPPFQTNASGNYAAANDPAKLAATGARVRERLLAQDGVTRIAVDQADVFLVPDFATRQECKQLVRAIDKKIDASPLFKGTEIDGFRTSSTHYFDRADPAVARLERRMADLLGIPVAHGEQMQGQRYHAGQQFKHHYDYFTVTEPYWPQEARRGGQRTFTAMLYLNEPEEGGATDFPHLGTAFLPKRGLLLAWNNMGPDGLPNPATLHAGTPVGAGTKHIVTQWYRQDEWTLHLR